MNPLRCSHDSWDIKENAWCLMFRAYNLFFFALCILFAFICVSIGYRAGQSIAFDQFGANIYVHFACKYWKAHGVLTLSIPFIMCMILVSTTMHKFMCTAMSWTNHNNVTRMDCLLHVLHISQLRAILSHFDASLSLAFIPVVDSTVKANTPNDW